MRNFVDEREKFLYCFVLFCLCMYMHEKQAYVRPVSDVELLEFTFDLTIVSYIVVIYKQDFILQQFRVIRDHLTRNA